MFYIGSMSGLVAMSKVLMSFADDYSEVGRNFQTDALSWRIGKF